MISALALACITAAQPQTVTFTHPCAHSSVVLAALGEELNLTLKPSGSVSKDYFLVRFKEIPVQQAFDKIAETLNATWTRKDNVTYLGRSRAQEIADFEIEYDAKKAAITKAIAKMDVGVLTAETARSLAIRSRDFGPTTTNADWERYKPIARQLPGYRAMFRIIKLLDLDTVVKALGSPVKFSAMSDGMPFPDGTDAILRQMRNEWAVVAREAGEVGITPDDGTIGTYLKFASTSPLLTDRLQLSVHPSDGHVLFQMSFVADASWQTIGRYSLSYAEDTILPEWVSQLTAPAKMDANAYASIAPSTLGQESPALSKALLSSGQADIALSAPSELLLQAAEIMDVSLVAQLPDSVYLSLAKAKIAGASTLSQMLTLMLTDRELKLERNDGWLTAKPSAPYTARRKRMDRAAFTAMFGHAVQKQSIPLEVFARFAATTSSDDPVTLANHLVGRAIKLRIGLPTIGIVNLRVYGLLTAAEQRQAKSESVTLTGRPDARRFVMALGERASQYVHSPNADAPTTKRPFREFEEALALIADYDKWTISVREEGFLQLNLLDRDVSSWLTFMDVHSFAMNMVSAERRTSPTAAVDYSAMAPVYGATVFLGYERQGGGGTSFGRYADPIGDAAYGPISELPDELRTRLQKEIDGWRERRSGGGGGE